MKNACEICNTTGLGYPMCCRCEPEIAKARRTPQIEVVSIGRFAGNSFGCDGNPNQTSEFFKVAGVDPGHGHDKFRFIFRSESRANKCCDQERAKASDAAQKRVDEVRRRLRAEKPSWTAVMQRPLV